MCQTAKLEPEWEVLDSVSVSNTHHSTTAVFQVNGTLVTHSNHIEVVKLIKCKFLCLCSSKCHILEINLYEELTLYFVCFILAGSYVALTVLGRPPGLAQIPLSEAESEMLGVSISSPNSPAAERPYSPLDRLSSTQSPWVLKPFVTSVALFPQTCLPSSSSILILFEVFTWVIYFFLFSASPYFIFSHKFSVCCLLECFSSVV